MRILVALMAAAALSNAAVYKVELDVGDDQHFSIVTDASGKGKLEQPKSEGGAKIECAVEEADGKAALHADIEVTRVLGQVNQGGISQPVIGQRKIAFDAKVDLNAPTVVVVSQRVRATITKVN